MSEPSASTPFSHLYGRLLQEFAGQVEERAERYGKADRNIREEIVRCLWFGSHFNPEDLATDDGRRLEVLSPGWWNVEGGPDFIRAEVLLEGAGHVLGDVEVHTNASGWYAHGHDQQPEYDDVVLHVVMWNDLGDRPPRRHSGEPVPQLTLSRFVLEEVGELVEIVDLEEGAAPPEQRPVPGRYCSDALAQGRIRPEWMQRLLDCAGDHRLLTKAERARGLLERASVEQILYESVAEALGYKHNRMPFLQLADLLPLQKLREMVPADAPERERRLALEAAFYGAGGFLEGDPSEADAETAQYLKALRKRWKGFPEDVRGVQMSADHWSLGGTRPVNYPTRRLAALSGLYAPHLPEGLFGRLVRLVSAAQPKGRRRLDVVIRDSLTGVFTGLSHPYWSHRYVPGGKRLAKPVGLVGAERAESLLTNVLIPLLLANARSVGDDGLVERLQGVWCGLPRRQPNAVVRRMVHLLFGDHADLACMVSSARRQQGLHQLYNDFCNVLNGCGSCVVYLAHQAGKQLAEA